MTHIFKILGIAGAVTAGGFVAVYSLFMKQNEYSLVYFGKDRAFEHQLDEELGIPLTKMIPYLTNFQLRSLFYMSPNADLAEPIEKMRLNHPQSMLPDLMMYYAYRLKQHSVQALESLSAAHRIVQLYPDFNRPLLYLLPPEGRLAAPYWKPY